MYAAYAGVNRKLYIPQCNVGRPDGKTGLRFNRLNRLPGTKVTLPTASITADSGGLYHAVYRHGISTMILTESLLIALLHTLGDTLPVDRPDAVDIDVPRLVMRAQRGDRDAVATLYQVHVDLIYRYIYFRVPTQHDAEDLAAEVFVQMVERLPNYRITGAPFEAWLYRIAASRVADFYRGRKRHSDDEISDDLSDDSPGIEDLLEQEQLIGPLRAALLQLPDEHQNILVLRFIERKSHEEVAELLGKSVTAVKSAQHRALTRLTDLLGQNSKARHYLRGQHE
jgi:RNA polymerase sigma-70 factor, ECF subfamily